MWKSSKVDTKGNSERERATIKQREKHRSEKKKKALILSRSPRHHVGSVSCLPFNDMATRLCRLSNYKATIRDEMKTVLSLSFLYYYYYNCYYLTDFIIINWLRHTHTHTSAKSKHERKDTRSIEEQAMSWNVYINKQVRIYTSCKHLLSFSIIIFFFFLVAVCSPIRQTRQCRFLWLTDVYRAKKRKKKRTHVYVCGGFKKKKMGM